MLKIEEYRELQFDNGPLVCAQDAQSDVSAYMFRPRSIPKFRVGDSSWYAEIPKESYSELHTDVYQAVHSVLYWASDRVVVEIVGSEFKGGFHADA